MNANAKHVRLLALASVVHYLGNGIFGSAPDRWYGAAMVYMIIALSQEWTDDADPMSHPLYHSTEGIPVLVSRITDTRSSIRTHPVVRLRVRGETEGEFDVGAVVPRIAVPRVGDIVRVVTHPGDPARYRYAGPLP